MTAISFDKMHGLGNDFVIFDSRTQSLAMEAGLARAIADRKTGIGCDQLILLGPSEKADLSMRIFNSDGGEVEACGNASRCVVAREGRDCTIETSGGILSGSLDDGQVAIDLGEPRFDWQDIPLDYAVDTQSLPVAWGELAEGMAVNVGNPHVIFFVEDADAVDLAKIGPEIETDPIFPERVNVNVASVADGAIKLHVWERGVGLTRACGTGACATAVAAIRRGLVDTPVTVELPGGTLTISWSPGATITMQGPATHVYSGSIDLDAFRVPGAAPTA